MPLGRLASRGSQRWQPRVFKTFHGIDKREWPLFFAIFLDLVGFGMAFIDLQFRAEVYGASSEGIGLILASYSAVQLVVSPIWGRISDRVGRKPILLICTFLSAMSMLVYAFFPTIIGIIVSRVLAGFAAANVVVGQAYLVDVTNEEQRKGAMGRVNAAILLGLILGPTVGGEIVTRWGSQMLGLVAAAASLLSSLWIWVGIPHLEPREIVEPGKKNLIFNFSILRQVPGLLNLFAVTFAGWFVLACLEGTFGRLIQHNLGYGQREFGWVFSYESLLGAGISASLGWFAARASQLNLLRVGYMFQGIGVAMFPLAPNLWVIFIASSIYAFGLGICTPTANAVLSSATPEERQGELFGVIQAARSFGFLFGPFLGGYLFGIRPSSPYFLAAGVAFLAMLIVRVPRQTLSGAPTHPQNAQA